jgi:hypothetical protein
VLRRFEERRAILPLDPRSDGTWIAVSDAGLIMTLLNVNASARARGRLAPPWSRGTIIPTLLPAATLSQALTRAKKLEPSLYAPFRLVMTDGLEWAEVYSDGVELVSSESRPFKWPELVTSSGLGDGLVEAPRRKLFTRFVANGNPTPGGQDAFHQHAWPEYPHLSVFMRRPDAETVSITTVQLGQGEVRMTYQPTATDEPAEASSLVLPLAREAQ